MTALPVLAVIFAAAVVISVSVGVRSWRRRAEAAGFGAITVLAAGAGWWSALSLTGLFAREPDTVLWVLSLAYPGIFALVAGWWATSRALTDRSWRLRRGSAALLAVEPVLTTVALASNPWHHLFIDHLSPTGVDGVLNAVFGPLFWVHAGYSYLMVVLSGITIFRMYARNPRRYRGYLPAVLASLPSFAMNVAGSLSGGRLVDLTPIGFALGAPVMYWVVRHGSAPASAPVTYRELIRTMSDLVVVVDGRSRVVDHNPAAGRLLALLERDAAEIFGELPAEDAEFSVTDIAGTGIDLSVRVSVLDTSATRLLVARDVTEQNRQRLALEEANDQLRTQLEIIEILRGDLAEQAVRDELTGLHNRRHLMAELTARVETGRPLCVALIDIDHFKQVNDRYGHPGGDEVLRRVAGVLATAGLDGDVVARYGGEEFALVLDGANVPEATARIEALRRRVQQTPVRFGGTDIAVTFSAGVAEAAGTGDVGALISAADVALYASKADGRNRVTVGRSPAEIGT
ncbi:histidine kinase N-terminal 7TM domain-containing diguanylate cyclase [Actinoplanes subglobosus]|uniref:Diguanylate cyclase n=1 Tax=Actinoplanes subglobosus TaxID=1547892 RepID=A0ABV8J1B1_9ACTN